MVERTIPIGDYNNELGMLYSALTIYRDCSAETYQEIYGLKKGDYIFAKIPLLKTFQERYAPSVLEGILENSSKETLEKINFTIAQINSKLKSKSENMAEFGKLMENAISLVKNS